MAKVKNRRDNHYIKRPKSGAAYGELQGAFDMRAERDAHKKSGEKYAVREDARRRAGSRTSAAATSGRQSRSDNREAGRSADLIIGRNPVTEALKAGREIDKIFISSREGSIKVIIGLAKDLGIPVIQVEKSAIDRLSDGRSHQGVAAFISPYAYSDMETIFERAAERDEDPFIIILDGLEDPHNLGAIMRTAECAGAHGIIIPKRHSCGLTETVAKASAGAIEYMPVVKVTNIAQTIDELKDRGVWVAACDMGGGAYYDTDISGKIAIVIGSEGFGIGKLVREKCDYIVSMPMVGKITSLNASNAAAVIAYEVRRQRDIRKV